MSEDKEKEHKDNKEAEEIFEFSEEDLERLSGGLNLDHLMRKVKNKKGQKSLKKFKPRDGNKH